MPGCFKDRRVKKEVEVCDCGKVFNGEEWIDIDFGASDFFKELYQVGNGIKIEIIWTKCPICTRGKA